MLQSVFLRRALAGASFALVALLAACGGGGGSPASGGDAVASVPPGTPQQRIEASLGAVPAACAIDAGRELARTTVEDTPQGTVDRVQIRSCGKVVSLYEATPAGATAQTPVVIALHQTTDVGKDEVMGYRGDPALAYGRTLFEHGFVVVAPDEFIAGDNFDPATSWSTAPFYREFPDWSAMGRMLQDHLAVSRFVAQRRAIACTTAVGHSLGGHNALFLAAFDGRIAAVVSSAGFERIATDDYALRWAADYFTYMPLLKPYVSAPAPRVVPWDFIDVLELITPRPILVLQGSADTIWTHPESVPQVVGELRAAHPDAPIQLVYHAGGHVFGSDLQQQAVDFVEKACPLPAP